MPNVSASATTTTTTTTTALSSHNDLDQEPCDVSEFDLGTGTFQRRCFWVSARSGHLPKLAAFVARVKAHTKRPFALIVDTEADFGLNRACGSVDVIQIGEVHPKSFAVTPTPVFIIDGKCPQTIALARTLLSQPHVHSLFWDCRRDTDALWHVANIRPAHVIDVQLLALEEPFLRFHPQYSSYLRFRRQGRPFTLHPAGAARFAESLGLSEDGSARGVRKRDYPAEMDTATIEQRPLFSIRAPFLRRDLVAYSAGDIILYQRLLTALSARAALCSSFSIQDDELVVATDRGTSRGSMSSPTPTDPYLGSLLGRIVLPSMRRAGEFRDAATGSLYFDVECCERSLKNGRWRSALANVRNSLRLARHLGKPETNDVVQRLRRLEAAAERGARVAHSASSPQAASGRRVPDLTTLVGRLSL
jgi:hypothetical protein